MRRVDSVVRFIPKKADPNTSSGGGAPSGGSQPLDRITIEKLRAKLRSASYSSRGVQDYEQLFHYYDRDKDSVLEGKEMTLLLAKVMPGLSDDQANQVCSLLDSDGDGKVSLQDFLEFSRSSRDEAKPRAPPGAPSLGSKFL